MKYKVTTLLALGLVVMGLANSASANPPFSPDLVSSGNRWSITFYDDSSPVHAQWATQGICFYYAGTVGTQQRYVWVSDTYPDWNGVAAQEGDQIFMHGDFQWPYGQQKDGGHDGMQWEIVTVSKRNEGAGHWHEWIEDGRFGINIGFGNTRFERVGQCQIVTVDDAIKAYAEIERPRDSEGKYLENPMGVNPGVQDSTAK